MFSLYTLKSKKQIKNSKKNPGTGFISCNQSGRPPMAVVWRRRRGRPSVRTTLGGAEMDRGAYRGMGCSLPKKTAESKIHR